MFTGILIRNFKAFGPDAGWIELRPVTMLLGENSAGKSTLMQALLVLAQSWRHEGLPLDLTPTGSITDLGTARNVLHHGPHEPSPRIELGLEMDGQVQGEKWRLIFSWDLDMEDDDCSTAPLRKVRLERWYQSKAWTMLLEAIGSVEDQTMFASRRPDEPSVGVGLTFPPRIRQDGSLEELPQQEFITSASVSRHSDISWRPADSPPSETSTVPDFDEQFRSLTRLIENRLRSFRDRLQQMSHIGPLRHRGQRIYRVDRAARHWRVGASGEHLVDVLFWDRDNEDEIVPRVNDQLASLGLEIRLEVAPISRSGDLQELLIRPAQSTDEGHAVGLMDVGSGVAQVLPFLVQLAYLRSPRRMLNSPCVLIEQPELHLHPRLQANLATLIAEATRAATDATRTQVLLETHSEHLIYGFGTEIRRSGLAANSEVSHQTRFEPSDAGCLQFVRSGPGRTPVVTMVGFREDGEFDGTFPAGFFPERMELRRRRHGA
jgi:predicted ATPase